MTTVPRFRSNIPSRGDLPFVGRDTQLAAIAHELGDPARERVLVLHGPPGVGKSELAREFARHNRDRYPGGTFFISVGGGELVELARIGANVLGLVFPADLSINDQCERTLLSFGAAPVLLIYDNPISQAAVEPWLPRSGMPCQVLITTVNEYWNSAWPGLAIEPLDAPTSLELIQRIAGAEVAERLGSDLTTLASGLPSQLVPASRVLAYAARRGRLDSAALRLAPEARNSFDRVYQSLEQPVQLLLHTAARLATQRIIRAELFHGLVTAANVEPAELDHSLDVCLDFHLLEGNTELRMHQLFATSLRETTLTDELVSKLELIQHQQRDRLVELAHDLAAQPANHDLASALLTYRLNPAAWDGARLAIPINHGEVIGQALIEIGQYAAAQPWFERAVIEKEQGDIHGRVDHQRLGTSVHQVGFCLSSLGQCAEAQPWFERAVAEAEQGDIHGRVDHQRLGTSVHQVGFCLSSLGQCAEAQPWFERAVIEKEQGDLHGRVDHTSLGASLNQVGYCLSRLGQYAEAQPWFERAVAEAEQGDIHGRVDHERLGASLQSVAVCCRELDSSRKPRSGSR